MRKKQKRGLFVVVALLAILFLFSNKGIIGYLLYPIANKEACTQDYAAETNCTKPFSGRDCSSNDYPTVYSPWDYTYCSSSLACVHKYKCYPQNSVQTLSGKTVFCNTNRWWDFDNRKLACEGVDDCGRAISIANKPTTWKWIRAGSYNVGEYDDLVNEECCGDDANEYLIEGVDKTTACCQRNTNIKVVNGMCVYNLGPWTQYTGGSAVSTWATLLTHKGGTQNFRVYETGRLLKPKESPWGNTDLGIFSDFRRELETHVYTSTTDSSDPNTNGRIYEAHSCIDEEIYGDGYDNDCDGIIDKPLEFYGYWQLNVGRLYNNPEDTVATLGDMEATKDYTNYLLIALKNKHLHWNPSRKNEIKNFINYAYENNKKLVFGTWGIKDSSEKDVMENTLKQIKCILDELNDSDNNTGSYCQNVPVTPRCKDFNSINYPNTPCYYFTDADGGYVENVYDKVFGFHVWEEPYLWGQWTDSATRQVRCEYIKWWIDEVRKIFPNQKISFDAGEAGAVDSEITACQEYGVDILNSVDYIEFFFYPDRVRDLDWYSAYGTLNTIRDYTNKSIISIGQATGARDADEIDELNCGGTNGLIIPTIEETREFYNFAKENQLDGLLWYIYRKEKEPQCLPNDAYGAHRYPEVIEEHKNIWEREELKASCC